MFGPSVTIYCKDATGDIIPWPLCRNVTLQPWHRLRYKDDHFPLRRMSDLFFITHYIVYQARPYYTPLLKGELHRPGESQAPKLSLMIPRLICRLLSIHTRLRLTVLDIFGYLPNFMRRLLLEEYTPAPGIIVLPALSYLDYMKIFRQPTKRALQEWIRRGEMGAWQSMSCIKMRCTLEFELEAAYRRLQRWF